MKRTLIIAIMSFFGLTSFAQSTNETSPKEFAELQTKELVDYYKLSDELKARIFEINFLCASKVGALKADKQMSQDVINEGIKYNYDLRDKSIQSLLNESQLNSYSEFQLKSVYNKRD